MEDFGLRGISLFLLSMKESVEVRSDLLLEARSDKNLKSKIVGSYQSFVLFKRPTGGEIL